MIRFFIGASHHPLTCASTATIELTGTYVSESRDNVP
jgi:hypothetical protein